MILYQDRPQRTLDALIARFAQAPAGTVVEAWTFDDAAARRRAEGRLAVAGVTARLRSAYKPLVCFFREEARPGFTAARIAYPVHPAAEANRFLLEAYPLAALLAPAEVAFVPGDSADTYAVTLTYPAGEEVHRVLAPNRLTRDPDGTPVLSPCGWLIADGQSAPLETDAERLFHGALSAIAAHDWTEEPYFDELNIAVTLPAEDEPLPVGDEALSLREAMHEDLYFAALEHFGRLSGRPAGDRHLQPGQIVPEVTAGAPAVTVSLRPLTQAVRGGAWQVLDRATAPPPAAQIEAELASLGGTPLTAHSRAGRVVHARHLAGRGAPVMISAGQHANETSPVVGALRAGAVLRDRRADFVISPMENPDGYALHGRLVADNPRHMHHAARYTAFGDDMEYRQDRAPYERAIRVAGEAASGAALHINLHGYPAHEWTRPWSGYIPRGFAMWTIPKGFFLILRHHPGWDTIARDLARAVTADLAAMPRLMAMNARQIALYRTHAGETGFEVINGFPCLIGEDARHSVPVTLITEYPDETIYGDAYIAAHEAQMRTVLAAHAAWQDLARPAAAMA